MVYNLIYGVLILAVAALAFRTLLRNIRRADEKEKQQTAGLRDRIEELEQVNRQLRHQNNELEQVRSVLVRASHEWRIVIDSLAYVLVLVDSDGIIRKVPFYKAGFNGAQVVLASGGGGTIYYAAGGLRLLPGLPESYDIFRQVLLPLFMCVVVYFAINSFSVSIAIGLQRRIPPLRIWRSHFRWTIFSNIALVAPLGLLMAFIQVKIGIWAVFYCFL